MTICVIHQHQWHTQQWQNGGGITHQLARADDSAGMLWRLSIADVSKDGPFSRFDDIERIILLLDGAGFRLHGVGNHPEQLSVPLQPFKFAGETAIHCELINGPVRDFNLMYRRGSVSAHLETITLNRTSEQHNITGQQNFVFVAGGSVQTVINDNCCTLECGQTLNLQHESGSLLLSSAGLSQVLLIQLHETVTD